MGDRITHEKGEGMNDYIDMWNEATQAVCACPSLAHLAPVTDDNYIEIDTHAHLLALHAIHTNDEATRQHCLTIQVALDRVVAAYIYGA